MATITSEQVSKFNARCHNGFELDVWGAIMNGEKDPKKDIWVSDTQFVRAQLTYQQEGYGVGANGDFKTYQPCLHLSIWTMLPSGCAGSSGLGKWIPVDGEKLVARRNYNKLADMTEQFSDAYILKLAEKYMPQLKNARIL